MSPIRVECHAGYRGEETPRRFHLEGRTIEVAEIIERRMEPDGRVFRVRGDDTRDYILRSDQRTGRWEIPEVRG
jgi:hypothetical protein